MDRRGAGVAFLAIAAFLFAMRYVVVAMLVPKNAGWSLYDYHMVLHETGGLLLLLSILFFIAGLVYFILGDFPNGVRRYIDRAKENWKEQQEANKVWEESPESDAEKNEQTLR